MRPKSVQDAQSFYGDIKDGKWANELKFMVIFKVPTGFPNWINSATGKPVTKIYLNKDMSKPLENALQNLLNAGLQDELKTFDGCFIIRDVRGVPGKPSWHSYGLAIDINAADNGLGVKPVMSQKFVKCFTDAGFTWGGNFSRRDGMHFQWAE